MAGLAISARDACSQCVLQRRNINLGTVWCDVSVQHNTAQPVMERRAATCPARQRRANYLVGAIEVVVRCPSEPADARTSDGSEKMISGSRSGYNAFCADVVSDKAGHRADRVIGRKATKYARALRGWT